MFYVPVTDDYWKLPVTYLPVYSTAVDRKPNESSSYGRDIELSKVHKELAELREELNDLRLEKASCRLCSTTSRSNQCDEDCLICYPRSRKDNYSRTPSPVHYCSICDDYVVDETYPPPSPRSYKKFTKKRSEMEEDKLSEYLSRQLDLQRLHPRYIPEERPIWIPTGYKQDYPYRRWVTRQCKLSEP